MYEIIKVQISFNISEVCLWSLTILPVWGLFVLKKLICTAPLWQSHPPAGILYTLWRSGRPHSTMSSARTPLRLCRVPGLCFFCQKKAEDFASIHVVEKRVQTASRGPGTRQSRSEAEDTIRPRSGVVKKRTSASQRRLCRAVSRRKDGVICVHPRSGEAGAKADEC
jgi:hypothetical protein